MRELYNIEVVPTPSYIAGFIDGDGCIFIRKINNGYQSGISISQSRTNILKVIGYHFGGKITKRHKENKCEDKIDNNGYYDKNNNRNQFSLIIHSNEYEYLINYIKDYFVIKNTQINSLFDFYKLVNKPDKNVEKEKLFNICSESNKNIENRVINMKNINIEYIKGLFDAEGCIYIDKNNFNKFYLKISQKNHPIILYEIVKILKYGYVKSDSYLIIYNKEHCLQFINLIKDGLIVKNNQVKAFEIFLNTNDVSLKKEMYKITNEEKHKTEEFDECDFSKKAFLQKKNSKENMNKVIKQINQLELNKQKSENMKGENNHNYGKKFSEQRIKKMSVSIRNAKGGVSDKTILKVRQLFLQGNRNKDIENLLNIPRHTVSKIKNGDLVCRNEERMEKNISTQNERNIKKRKVSLDEIYFILDKLFEKKLSQVQILSNINLLRENVINNKDNHKECLKIDVIKNISRNILTYKKLPFYDEENPEKYKYYRDLIDSYISS